METITLQLTDSVNRSHVRLAFVLIALACFAPQARATCQDACLAKKNTVQGDDALINTVGTGNTAIGFLALTSNFYGDNNTAIGSLALSNNDGYSNTATGSHALYNNATGYFNTATGFTALNRNLSGNSNTAIGEGALYYNLTGSSNVAIGQNALMNNQRGSGNIVLGTSAGSALTRGDNNIDIGNAGLAGEANTIRIGTVDTQEATFIAGINGVTVPDGVGVIVGADGKLGTIVSSARFKEAVKPMDKASEAIFALKPVAFRYKKELDPKAIPQFGLVAEEVEKIDPDLVARNKEGKPYSVRYEAVNAMVLNEFLKEHRTVEDLKQQIAALTAMVKEQAAQIRKVSAELAEGGGSVATATGFEGTTSSAKIVFNDR